ncbi:MAG TPA: hypothetical protein VGL89_05445 [Candidatus Koribacter sp.]|jgi:hypothetical protein
MISGITSSLYQSQIANQYQQLRSAFQQLGSDLSSGNAAAAEKDFTSLTQLAPANSTATTSGSRTAAQQEMQQLGKDLQSGNLSAAQQDYASIQRSVQQQHLTRHSHVKGPMNPTDPFNFATNLATTAAATYGTAALTGPTTIGSMLSQMI